MVKSDGSHTKSRRVIYGFIMLMVISSIMAGLAVMISLYAISRNNQDFCSLVYTHEEIPIAKPANPVKNPEQEQLYEIYEEYVRLGKDFHC
jgi:hypothetical protein